MADMIATGLEWLEEQRVAHMTGTVAYHSRDLSVSVPATKGRSQFDSVSPADVGVVERVESTDWLILTEDLDLGSGAHEPKRGDVVKEVGIDGKTYVYEVVPFAVGGGQVHWRWSDQYRRARRIHTKHVKTIDP